MDSEPKSEKIQNDVSKEEKPEHDNSNINENENKKTNDLNKDSQILDLKKEILSLKKQQNQYDSRIKEISNNFQKEIDSLKQQVKNLISELNELKSKKKPKDNINNINNENNDDSDENMDDDQSYSIECLTKRLNIEIMQGTEKANIDIIVRNNSNFKYPKDSFLICDNKNSLLLCEKVELNELNPKEQQKVSIVFNNLKFISKGKYKCFIKLMINNKKYNSTFELTIDVLENYLKNDYQAPSFLNNNQMQNNLVDFSTTEQMVNNFKIQFQLYNNDIISDEKIENVLRKNNFDFNKAFEDLFN